MASPSPALPTPVVNVTAATFAAEVLERSRHVPVVVDFWAAWCGPCRMIGPVLEKLAHEAGGAWVLAKIDTDAEGDLAGRFQIQGIPAVKAFVDGAVVAEFTGVRPEAQLRAWIGALAPSPADREAQAARAAFDAGDRPAATAAAQRALAADPRHPAARALGARLAADAGDLAQAQALLDGLSPADRGAHAALIGPIEARLASGGRPAAAWLAELEAAPQDPAVRWGAAHALAAEGRLDEALGHLLELVRSHRRFDDDGARKAMLALFQQLGDRDPLTQRWRRRLEMALF
jgi:putative thioredoxin